MSSVSEFLNAVFRTVLKLTFVVASGILVLSFLAAALVVVLAVSLWSLITGRKPAPVMMFDQFRARSRQFSQGAWSQPAGRGAGPGAGATASGRADPMVVDVEAVEVSASPAARRPLRD